jgi:integrase
MASITSKRDKLYIDFRFQGVRFKEMTGLADTPVNRRRLMGQVRQVDDALRAGTFDYLAFFPEGSRAHLFQPSQSFRPVNGRPETPETPSFEEFAELWFQEKSIEWRKSYSDTIRGTLDKYLIPAFGSQRVGDITKADILNFRSNLAKAPGRKQKSLSPDRINHIMTPLRVILNEAADRYDFTPAWRNIKALKVPRSDVEPFSLEEVMKIITHVRSDFRHYYVVRFFTGLRTGEVDGLLWEKIDFDRRQVLVHQALVREQIVPTKTDGSFRSVDMNQRVYEALRDQWQVTGQHSRFVFCNREGGPLHHANVTKRVWYPLLRYLGLKKRRPYQTRHTAATLWLASGENPEWIARQMGHTTTDMLFRVYSRYVPNLTRRDGDAFEQLLSTFESEGGSYHA